MEQAIGDMAQIVKVPGIWPRSEFVPSKAMIMMKKKSVDLSEIAVYTSFRFDLVAPFTDIVEEAERFIG
jgi:hypothetical protein